MGGARMRTTSLLVAWALGAGCGWSAASREGGAEADDSHAAPVVGGHPENGYLAAGYVLSGATPTALTGPHCGAALIEPNIAVTAAHCVYYAGAGAHLALGLGQVDA